MSWLKNLFNSTKELNPILLDSLKADMHSHLIPGVDDGAKDMDDSISLIRKLKFFGFSHFITTPHIMSDIYPNTKEGLTRSADELKEELARKNIDVTLELGAEYFLDQHFLDLIKKRELLTFSDNYLLFEMSFVDESPLLQECIFELQSAGIKPILAHPERYTYLHGKFEKYEELAEQGVHLQLNINSVTGHYSPQTAKVSEKLIENNLISYLGTDCHHQGHLELLNKAVRHPLIHKLIEKNLLLNKNLG